MISGNPGAERRTGPHARQAARAPLSATVGACRPARLRTAFTIAGLALVLGPGLLSQPSHAQTQSQAQTQIQTQIQTQAQTPPQRSAPATASTATAKAWNLDALLAEMSLRREARARFTERQFLSLLDAPVDASGELLFVAPDRLEKRTLSPRRESLIVAGDQLKVEQGGLSRSLSLGQIPEAAALIESLRATMNGDRKTLESVFEIQWQGRREQWQMQLVPRDARSRGLVAKITLSGAAADVQTVEIEQRDGDRSVMRILPER